MAFLCPSRVGRATTSKKKKVKEPRLKGRITGSDSIDSLVRVGLRDEDQHLKPDSKMVITRDFNARVGEEVDVRVGQEVYFLYQESQWTYVVTDVGKEGFIPSACCSKVTGGLLTESNSITPEDRKSRGSSSGDAKSNNSSASSVKKLSETLDTDSFHTEGLSEFSKHSGSSSLKTETTMTPEVRWFRKTSHGQFIVLYDFQALDENDVTVERAELVEVLNIEDPDWSWIRSYNGDEGFVPKSYICPVEPLLAAQEKVYNNQNANQSTYPMMQFSNQSHQAPFYVHQPYLHHQQLSLNIPQSLQPLTDSAKRENAARVSAQQNLNSQKSSANHLPHQTVYRDSNQNYSLDVDSGRVLGQTKNGNQMFSDSKLRDANTSATSDETEISQVLQYDKYRTAINDEIKKLGKFKNGKPEFNLLPSKNCIKHPSRDAVKDTVQKNGVMNSKLENKNNEDFRRNHNTKQSQMVPVRGTSPTRKGKESSGSTSSHSVSRSRRGASPVGRNGKGSMQPDPRNAFSGPGESGSTSSGTPQNKSSSDSCRTNHNARTSASGNNIERTSTPGKNIGRTSASGNNIERTSTSGNNTSQKPQGSGDSGENSNTRTSTGQNDITHRRQGSEISNISVTEALKTSDITEYIVMYDYTAQSKNDLTVKHGDIVYVDTTDQNDQHWLWVYCPQLHMYGYVPKAYVKIPIKTTL